jgi:hypothetical protein
VFDPQVDQTVHELVRVVTKMVLLYLPSLAPSPAWPALWVGVLGALSAAAGSGSEVLAEGVPPALQNLLLMLHDRVSGGRGGWGGGGPRSQWSWVG